MDSESFQKRCLHESHRLMEVEAINLVKDLECLLVQEYYRNDFVVVQPSGKSVGLIGCLLQVSFPKLFETLKANEWQIFGDTNIIEECLKVVLRYACVGDQPNRSELYSQLLLNSIQNQEEITPSYKEEFEKKYVTRPDADESLTQRLLRLFETGLQYDIKLQSEEMCFPAHRCILAARCNYFASMLHGGWIESGVNLIPVPQLSSDTLKELLLYIYGKLPNKWSLELFLAADMFDLPGLSLCMVVALKRDKCHFFHKPCINKECIIGTLEAVRLCSIYEHCMGDLSELCYQHMTQYYSKMAVLRQFAALPTDVFYKCEQSVYRQLSYMNVMTTALEMDKVQKLLIGLKWSKPALELTERIYNECIKYIASHMKQVVEQVLATRECMAFGSDLVELVLTNAIQQLPLEGTTCGIYQELCCLKSQHHSDQQEPEDVKLLATLKTSCSKFIGLHIGKIMKTDGWKKLDSTSQKYLQDVAGFVMLQDPPKKVVRVKLTKHPGLNFVLKKTTNYVPPVKTNTTIRKLPGITAANSATPGVPSDKMLPFSAKCVETINDRPPGLPALNCLQDCLVTLPGMNEQTKNISYFTSPHPCIENITPIFETVFYYCSTK